MGLDICAPDDLVAGARCTVKRWKPPIEITTKEQLIMKRLGRVRTLFGFLRAKRHLIFDDAFQAQLEEVYLAATRSPSPISRPPKGRVGET
ncbi:Mobile element protein [Minicystis rosea]|nr:Mobile element protein [Minicystis rosea]